MPGSHSSTVVTDGAPSCRAPDQGGKCLDCRACWDKDVKNVSYGKHKKEELIEELEAILKANKKNLYCDEYQIADMIKEAQAS